MGDTSYTKNYYGIDFRKHPEKYIIGKGEQGVLMAEPYKSELLPYWRFATAKQADASAKKIYRLFLEYKKANDFVGMDMARKFLQMGFTRSRRYANHPSGHKYNDDGSIKPQDTNSENSEKAKAAKIFYTYYLKAKNDHKYIVLKERFLHNL